MFKNLKKLFFMFANIYQYFADIADKMFSGLSPIFCRYQYYQHWLTQHPTRYMGVRTAHSSPANPSRHSHLP